ncbi:hypothetical protein D9M71_493840 [compost metagenome]
MATGDEGLVLDLHVFGRHQVVAEARRNVQHVFRTAAEVVEHVLEGLQARLVGLGLLGGEDLVERHAQLVDVGHDLFVHRVGEDHQRDLVGDLRQAGRHVGMRAPGRHGVVVQLSFAAILDAPALAQARHGGIENFIIWPPVTHHLIQAISGEILDELVHLLRSDAIGEQLAGQRAHLEVGQRAVAVEGDVLGAHEAHLGSPESSLIESDDTSQHHDFITAP